MQLTSDQVKKVAKLANLPLSEDEEEKYAGQLSVVLEYINQLNKVDTKGVEPTYNVSGNENALRSDEAESCLTQADALLNGSNITNGFFVTKGVFKEE
ncbi:Asp-tRNA(Asn)/Glu-tRNA(Gln) amidotransferase subunit GatC [Candidatus Daviesbacteria bacterium]|nr:Asp-tRNA(Asn)/Glu-tRNA(Gln) amidotransferase subunit GatC [Candidatus Daviesbacteria bacterium]